MEDAVPGRLTMEQAKRFAEGLPITLDILVYKEYLVTSDAIEYTVYVRRRENDERVRVDYKLYSKDIPYGLTGGGLEDYIANLIREEVRKKLEW